LHGEAGGVVPWPDCAVRLDERGRRKIRCQTALLAGAVRWMIGRA